MDANVTRTIGSAYSCLACQAAFASADEQRLHYRSEWHRYNLKRKIAELPPVTLANFGDRLEVQKTRSQEDLRAKITYRAYCDACDKTYSSENAYRSHVASKKHKQLVEQQQKQAKKPILTVDSTSDNANDSSVLVQHEGPSSAAQDTKNQLLVAKEFQSRLQSARTEEEIEQILQEKLDSAPKLSPDADCLFCSHQSDSLELNLQHMSAVHSFFLPDLDCLTDVRGLVEYLGEKVAAHNVCLYCNGKGKAFQTMDSVRKHMVNKGHTKLLFDEETEMEYEDFYDFDAQSWENVSDDGQVDDEDETTEHQLVRHEHPAVDEAGMEMVLPSGHRIGHRSLNRYYRQHFAQKLEKESVLISRLSAQYQAMGWRGHYQDAGVTKEQVYAHRQRRKEQTHKELRINRNANGLQKHFRVQILV